MNTFKTVKETFDEIYGSLPIPVTLFDENARLVKSNQAFLDISQRSHEDISDLTASTFFSAIKSNLDKNLTFKSIHEHYFTSLNRSDGGTIPIELNHKIFKGEDGLIKGALFYINDLRKVNTLKGEIKQLSSECEALRGQLGGEKFDEVLKERKSLGQDVENTKDFLENIFKTNADGIMTCNPEGFITMVNDSTAHMLGYSREELIGIHAKKLGPEGAEYEEKVMKLLETLYEDGIVTGFEYPWIKKDGSLVDTEINVTLLKDDEGNITEVLSNIRDITERKKSEEALKTSEEKYHNLIEYANDAIISANEEGVITNVNKKAEEMYGYSREESLGKSALLLVAPGDRKQQGQFLEKFKKHKEYSIMRKPVEGKHVGKDGKEFPVESSFSSSVMHGNHTFTAFVRNITERKRTIEELRETKEQLENFIDNSIDPIAICDNTGILIKVNRAFLKMIGYTEEEVIGKPIYDFSITEEGTYESTTGELVTIGQDFFKESLEKSIQLYEEGEVSDWFSYYMNKDNKIIPCNHNTVFLSNDKGEKTISFGIIRDMTEQRKAENATEKANRCRNQFFTNISHEFRTPLTLAMGPIEGILRNEYGRINGNLKMQLSLSLKNSRKLLKLINQLLEFSRLESGSQNLIYEKKNLKEFIATILDSFTFIAKKKNINLAFSHDDGINGAYIDPVKTEKVLFNLIGNAFKFTPEGGSITVKAANGEGSGDNRNGQVKILVKDTGIGIKKEYLNRIFERFRQADGDTAREYGGTGIGLALSKELVELMGGTIEVESKYGKGSTFSVHLPIREDIIKNGSKPSNGSEVALFHQVEIELSDLDYDQGKEALEENISGNKPLILVIDDNPDMRNYISSILKKDYDIITAQNGLEGLKRLDAHQLDLILCDIMMPRMDGYKFLKKIKSNSKHRHIPLIFLTAKADTEMKIEGLEEGADDYIVKPFNSLELRARVKALLRIRDLLNENLDKEKKIINLPQKLEGKYHYGNIIGKSKPMRKIYQMLDKIKNANSTIFLTGETGTGKELIANALHYNSPRKDGPMISVNCGAIPKELMEREFFGHAKGAYTGAHQDKKGYFDEADGGTLFLDEIGELDKDLQVKLLRALESGKIVRVGDAEPTKVDVRLIAASNKDLRAEVQKGIFREDLYYRIYVVPIHIPPLRERREDIPLLIEHFLKKFRVKFKKEIPFLSEETMRQLIDYHYPGNVRELEHLIERAYLLSANHFIQPEDIPLVIDNIDERENPLYDLPYKKAMIIAQNNVEKKILTRAISEASNNCQKAAQKLGISRSYLYKRLKSCGIESIS